MVGKIHVDVSPEKKHPYQKAPKADYNGCPSLPELF